MVFDFAQLQEIDALKQNASVCMYLKKDLALFTDKFSF